MDACVKCGRTMAEHPVPMGGSFAPMGREQVMRDEKTYTEDIGYNPYPPVGGWECETFIDPEFTGEDRETEVINVPLDINDASEILRSDLHGVSIGGYADEATALPGDAVKPPVFYVPGTNMPRIVKKTRYTTACGHCARLGRACGRDHGKWFELEQEIERVQPAFRRAWKRWYNVVVLKAFPNWSDRWDETRGGWVSEFVD